MSAILQSSYDDHDNDFYIIVNSDINGDFTHNTPSAFSTKLDQKLNLEGQWQCSIRSLYINHSWENTLQDSYMRIFHSLSGENCNVTTPLNLATHATALRPYIDIPLEGIDLHKSNFVDDLNKLIMKHMKTISNEQGTRVGRFDGKGYGNSLKFGYDLGLQHYFISLKYHACFIPQKLARAIGFRDQMFHYNSEKLTQQQLTKYVAVYPPHYVSDNDFLYIYSNVVEETSINNSRANILKITPVESVFGEILAQNYDKEMYINVNTSKLHEIRIEIRNRLGELIDAKFGSTIICLHFIKRSL